MDDMDEVIEEFLAESYEGLDQLDREFIELESDPTSQDLLASIFRTIHTVKGTSGFFGFNNLESVTHAGESLLSLLREEKLSLTVAITDALLTMVDAVRAMLTNVEQTKSDGSNNWSELIQRLNDLTDADSADSEEPAIHAAGGDEVSAASDASDIEQPETVDAAPQTEAAPQEPQPAAPAASTPPPVPAPTSATPAPDADATSSVADSSIRVDVSLLDRLMNLVGELVLARNQVLQYHASHADAAFQVTSQQLDLITTELQESVMQTRMQPIGNVWSKFPRIVRDLSANLDKKITLEMIGKETELDKTLIEAIKDPLTHIVRNSVDHGIELPADRAAAGKPETGVLTLRAFHEGGQVIIEISDDGGGLKLEKIREKAVSKGLVTAEQSASMTDRDLAKLIMAPGFSTADQVTNVSGRGVGMDVVRTNVEKIGGSLDITTNEGSGTTLTIKIPLTLAIIPALIITCDEDRYLIPQVNLVEVLHIGPETSAKLEVAGDAEVFRLRGNLLPIVHLRKILDRGPRDDWDPQDGQSIVVLHADGRQFGLVVDQINDTEEIVVKPLSPHLKSLGAYSGTTIMGDGAVSLILDAIGIARVSGVVSETTAHHDQGDAEDPSERRGDAQSYLVARVGDDRVAIPLALVSRLEELDASTVEKAAGKYVIQYRSRLLNLVHLAKLLGRSDDDHIDTEQPLRVLVHESNDQAYGLIVDEILDVFEADLSTGQATNQRGLSMSGVIGRRVTDLIDIEQIIEMADEPIQLVSA